MTETEAPTSLLARAGAGYRSTLIAQAMRLLCKAAAVLVLARLVSPVEHGLYAMAASAYFVLVLFRDCGLGAAAIQTLELTEEQCSTLWRAHQGLGLVLALVTLAVAPAVAAFYREPRVFGLLAALGFSFVLLGLNAWPRILLSRSLRFSELNRVETVAMVVATTAMVIAAALRADAYAFVTFVIVFEVMVLAMVWRACRWRPQAPVRWRSLADLARVGLPLTGHNLIAAGSSQIDSLLLGRWFGAGPLGFYNRPAQLLALANQHLCAPTIQVLVAALSRLDPASDHYLQHTRETANRLAYFTLPFAAVCISLADEIVRLILGASWPQAAPLLRWLALNATVSYLSATLFAISVASGKTSRLAAISAATFVTMIIGMGLGRKYGPEGVAAGVALANLAVFLPRMAWTLRGTGLRLRDFGTALLRPILLAVAFALGCLGGLALTTSPSWILRLGAGLAGGTVASTAVIATSASMRRELQRLW